MQIWHAHFQPTRDEIFGYQDTVWIPTLMVGDALSGAFILDASYISTHDCDNQFNFNNWFLLSCRNEFYHVCRIVSSDTPMCWGRFSKINWSTAMVVTSVMVKLQVTGLWRVEMDSGQKTSLQKSWMCSKGATHMSGTFAYYFIAFCTLSCAYLLPCPWE